MATSPTNNKPPAKAKPSRPAPKPSTPRAAKKVARKAPKATRKAPKVARKATKTTRKAPKATKKATKTTRKAPKVARKAPKATRKALKGTKKATKAPKSTKTPSVSAVQMQEPVAYYFTSEFEAATGGKSVKWVSFDVYGLVEKHGMDPENDEGASDYIHDWTFLEPFWKDVKKIRVPRRLRVLVPFGKYAKKNRSRFEICDYEAKEKQSTLVELIKFCVNKVSENGDKVLDGLFFEGFEVYKNGLWVFSLQA